MNIPLLALNDGRAIPQLGVGTSPMDDADTERVVLAALELGYRHVDTAAKYGNEVGVGRALAGSGVPREELFVTTKLDGPYQGDDRAVAGLDACLDRLGLEYVDLLLIHWPLPARDLFVSTWRTFERLQASGKARSIGVSNFEPAHLERLAAEAHVVPAVNQIQVYPGVPRPDSFDYHREHGIVTTAYSPLGKGGDVLSDPVVTGIAAKHGKSAAQVVLRWHVQRGTVVIPRTTRPERLPENAAVFDFALSAEEVAALNAIEGGPGVDPDVSGH